MTSAAPATQPTDQSLGWIKILMLLASLLVIAAMIVPSLGKGGRGPVDATVAAIHQYEAALTLYAVDHNSIFPTGSSEDVARLLMTPDQDENGKSTLPYIEQPPKDIWGQPLNYEWPNTKMPNAKRPAIWSNGVNKQNEDGTGDDIKNWYDQ